MEERKINKNNHWQMQMLEIIDISHPYLYLNMEEVVEIVLSKAEAAHKEYLRALLEEDKPILWAREQAREVLLSGYKWSPTDFLGSLYWIEFGKELSVEERVNLYIEYKDIFDQYSGIDLDAYPEKELEIEELILERINKQID